MREKDYVVSFRFPNDDFFVRHETNVCAENARDAMNIIRKHLNNIVDVSAHEGIVMLYGKKFTTIMIDIKRSNHIEMEYKKEHRGKK